MKLNGAVMRLVWQTMLLCPDVTLFFNDSEHRVLVARLHEETGIGFLGIERVD